MLYYLCYIYIIIYRGKTKAIRREGQSLDGLPSFPPRTRPPPSPPSGSKGKVEQKSKQKGRKRESGRRIPPPSSPAPRLSSVPSDASTVNTIASRSPLTTSHHHRREGRPPRPLLVDVIATPRQQPEKQRLGLSVILPASSSSSPLFPSSRW